MKKDLVSIIVPIYKVEEYLDKCVESLINQTYQNIEIILVDDGSPDNCPMLCDEWAKKDSRINVIHKENGGLSDARNYGIDAAKGDYIVFVDSDDYTEENMIENLFNSLKKEEADIAICNFYIEDENTNEQTIANNLDSKIFSCTGEEKYKYLFDWEYSTQTVVAWNKLYKINLFEKIRYPKGKLHEDEYIICELLKNANKVVYNLQPFYHYIKRDNSITSTFNLKRFDIIEALEKRISFFQKEGFDFYVYKSQVYEIETMEFLIGCAIAADKKNIIHKKIRDYLKILKTKSKEIIKNPYFIKEDREITEKIKRLSKNPLKYILVRKLKNKMKLGK